MNKRTKMTMAKAERKQQRDEAGLVSSRFPNVATIVISMTYRQIGVLEPMLRTINFFPGSYAVFMVNCLNEGCVGGGFDFREVIADKVNNLKKAAKGELCCAVCGPAAHFSDVVYDISIRYA